jgi:hypothetical protein
MKRVIRINVEGATNTCGISAVPTFDDTIEYNAEHLSKNDSEEEIGASTVMLKEIMYEKGNKSLR